MRFCNIKIIKPPKLFSKIKPKFINTVLIDIDLFFNEFKI